MDSIQLLSERINDIYSFTNPMTANSKIMADYIHEVDRVSKENAAETETILAAT